MEVAQGKQDGLELCLSSAHLQCILIEVIKSLMEIGLHSCRWLICDLDS